MESPQVDLGAVNRVARRVQLNEVRLAEASAKADHKARGLLEPVVEHECEALPGQEGGITVSCRYRFAIRCAGEEVAEATLRYVLDYSVVGDEPLNEADVSEFAFANGTYHSWPFVREALFSLTARMGYPPFTLPVFRFDPKPPAKAAASKPQGSSEAAHKDRAE